MGSQNLPVVNSSVLKNNCSMINSIAIVIPLKFMFFPPAEDIPDKPERTHRASHDWGRVEVGVVRNAVPNIDMSDFKRELVHATKVVANELNDKQSRVTVR